MDILVGYTGFVGSNLAAKHNFDKNFNSKNINQAYGLNPDICVYCGVRAEKFLANNEPQKDLGIINNAIENIKKINPKRLILISTVDVYNNPSQSDENTVINAAGLHAYGLNRLHLEDWVRGNIAFHNVIRLPGLFGKNIKKNFIYDLINFIPSMLNEQKFTQFSLTEPLMAKHYIKQNNGFYKCVYNTPDEKQQLIEAFKKLGFSALNFTDSRAVFQFYNLENLWRHIQIAVENNLKLVNLAVEPVSAAELYYKVEGKEFVNHLSAPPPFYNIKTVHDKLFLGAGGYIFNKNEALNQAACFVLRERTQ